MHGNGSLTCTGQYGRLSITLRTGAKQYLGGKLVCQNAHASPDEFFERSLALQSLHREKKKARPMPKRPEQLQWARLFDCVIYDVF